LSPTGWWSLAGDSYFDGTNWICPDLGSGGNNGTSTGMGGTELVGNGPGSTANGIATSMNIPENLQGNAPNSSKNAFSVNMNSADRVEDIPKPILPLDNYPGALLAISFRRLRSTYSGSVIRVRRDNDNAELDIGFSGNIIDETALLSHVGSNNGYIVTWYNQSEISSAQNITTPTASQQAQIVTNGTVYKQNGYPYAYFNNDFYNFYNTSPFLTPQPPYMAFSVQTRYDDTKAIAYLGRNNYSNSPRLAVIEANDSIQFFGSDEVGSLGNGTLSGTYDVPSTDMSLISGYQGQLTRPGGNYDVNALYLNNVLKDTTPAPYSGWRSIVYYFGRYVNTGIYGNVFEFIFYHDLLNSAAYQSNNYPTQSDFDKIRKDVNKHYSIY
jgi:hypothetical protein